MLCERLARASGMRERTNAVLRERGGECGVGQPGRKGRYGARVCWRCKCQLCNPARRLTKCSGTQVASRGQEHSPLCARQGRPELTLLLVGEVGVQRQRTVGERSIAVAQQCLGRRRRRQ